MFLNLFLDFFKKKNFVGFWWIRLWDFDIYFDELGIWRINFCSLIIKENRNKVKKVYKNIVENDCKEILGL